MAPSLNIIALVSGGKDSFFSILHCLHHGHKVVALANLRPPTDEDEMDSMTYQTVGHKIIPLYQHCTGIPVFQHTISGSTVCDDQDYAPPQAGEDETEDLFKLLVMVKKAVPEANAVSTGAILSTYQRTRVESVVIRLGMVPLAYLWQYPFLPPPPERQDSSTGLLEDMQAAGCDARLIKIASFGIAPSLLGQSLREERTITTLMKGLRRILGGDEAELRAAVLGEGGEYETLTVNGPQPLWKSCIEWTKQDSIQEGDVSYLNMEGANVYIRDPTSHKPLRIPAISERQFSDARAALNHQSDGVVSINNAKFSELAIDQGQMSSHRSPLYSLSTSAHHVSISNITALSGRNLSNNGTTTSPSTSDQPESSSATAGDQMAIISKTLHTILTQLNHNSRPPEKITTRNITSTTLLLASMTDFASVNARYIELFPHINPPARVTIATDLGKDVKVSLSVVLDLRPRSTRRSLHVQSRSYWAPANIGPYSQAVAEPLCSKKVADGDGSGSEAEVVSFAGQIPLVPVSMELAEGGPLHDTLLSLQHLWRVAQERKVDFWTWAIAYIAAGTDTCEWANTALEIWREIHRTPTRIQHTEEEDDPDIDIWDRTHNKTLAAETSGQTGAGEHMHILPNWDVIRSRKQMIPPFIAAEVLQLPRNAPIEWWGTGLGRLPRDSDARLIASTSEVTEGVIHSTVTFETSEDERATYFTSVFVKTLVADSIYEDIAKVVGHIARLSDANPRAIISGHCLVTNSGGWKLFEAMSAQICMSGVAVVPCRSLYTAGASEPDRRSELSNTSMALLVRTEN